MIILHIAAACIAVVVVLLMRQHYAYDLEWQREGCLCCGGGPVLFRNQQPYCRCCGCDPAIVQYFGQNIER